MRSRGFVACEIIELALVSAVRVRQVNRGGTNTGWIRRSVLDPDKRASEAWNDQAGPDFLIEASARWFAARVADGVKQIGGSLCRRVRDVAACHTDQ